MPEPQQPLDRKWWALMSTVGFEMVAPIGVGVFIDTQYGTRPWCSLLGVAVGFFGGIWHLLMILRAANREQDDQPRERP